MQSFKMGISPLGGGLKSGVQSSIEGVIAIVLIWNTIWNSGNTIYMIASGFFCSHRVIISNFPGLGEEFQLRCMSEYQKSIQFYYSQGTLSLTNHFVK